MKNCCGGCLWILVVVVVIVLFAYAPWAGVALLACLAVCGVVFVLLHVRPLTPDQVTELVEKRRSRAICGYYAFTSADRIFDAAFKKRMASSGRFYVLDEPLHQFPAVVASLLKGKQHEWSVIAFERDGVVTKMWAIKGPNRTVVYSGLDEFDVGRLAQDETATTVLSFHNHPNPDPSRLAMHMPSQTDINNHASCGAELLAKRVNHLAFVCERGSAYEFHRTISGAFQPRSQFRRAINKLNGTAWGANYSLHWERMFR